MSSNLPPGVTDAMIEAQWPSHWSEVFEASDEFKALPSPLQTIFHGLVEFEVSCELLDLVVRWATERSADDARSAEGEWMDCYFVPRLIEAGVSAEVIAEARK